MAEGDVSRRVPELRQGGLFDIAHGIVDEASAGRDPAVAHNLDLLKNGGAAVIAEVGPVIGVIGGEVRDAGEGGNNAHGRGVPGSGAGKHFLKLPV